MSDLRVCVCVCERDETIKDNNCFIHFKGY